MSIGSKIKELRAERGLTQNELSKRSGLNRGYVANLETDMVVNPSADTFLKLARAFNIRPEELYHAAGYIADVIDYLSRERKETSEDLLERLRMAHPATVPVYAAYPFDASTFQDPIEFLYRDRKGAKRSLEGYLIHGGQSLLNPLINDGDIIIVDKEGEIENGNIVACIFEGNLQLSKLRKIGGDLWLENKGPRIKFDDCQLAAPVIEVIRRLK